MNGVLGKNPNIADYQKIYNLISNNDGFLRTAWFTEKSPFVYHTEEKQALDAKDLVNFRPLASINVGTGDRFNFMNNNQYLDWFKLLGIKYLIFSGNPRVEILNKSDQEDWNRLLALTSKDNRLKKINLGTSFPVYENSVVMPNKFFVDKTYVVLGGDDIYQKFLGLDKNFSVSNQGFIFPEDGKSDPSLLQNVASTSAILIFNNKTENDLKMSFLQNDFLNVSDSYSSQWAIRKTGDYLNWKYELLQNSIDIHEFDYSKGIAFSSQPNEEIKFSLKVPTDGNYYLEVRSMDATNSGDLKVSFNHEADLIKRKTPGNFEWYEKGPITLTAGSYSLNLQNTQGFQVVNTIALVNDTEMRAANQLSQNFLGYFQHFNLNDQSDLSKIGNVLGTNKWETLSESGVTKPGWIIYTDSFNSNWNLERVNQNDLSYPMYSMVNGFYVHPEWGNVRIIFKGDEYIRWGVYFSVLSILSIVVVFLWKLSRKK